MLLGSHYDDAAITLTIFIFIFTIPSIRYFAKFNWRIKNPNLDQALYEDEDGVASRESTDKFSNKLPFIAAFTFVTIGWGLSIANTIFAAIEGNTHAASPSSHYVAIFLLVPAWVSPYLIDKIEKFLTDNYTIVFSSPTTH